MNTYKHTITYLLLVAMLGTHILYAQETTNDNDKLQKANTPEKRSDVKLNGFSNTSWGMDFPEVREKLYQLATEEAQEQDKEATSTDLLTSERTEIVNVVRNKVILTRRNQILYRYNFYKSPYIVAYLNREADTKAPVPAKYDSDVPGKLFHVQIQMPWIIATLIQKKLTERYGENNAARIKNDGSGAYIWQLDGGNIYQWVEHYDGKNYTRRIDYISSEYNKQISKEFQDYLQADAKIITQSLKVK